MNPEPEVGTQGQGWEILTLRLYSLISLDRFHSVYSLHIFPIYTVYSLWLYILQFLQFRPWFLQTLIHTVLSVVSTVYSLLNMGLQYAFSTVHIGFANLIVL